MCVAVVQCYFFKPCADVFFFFFLERPVVISFLLFYGFSDERAMPPPLSKTIGIVFIRSLIVLRWVETKHIKGHAFMLSQCRTYVLI